MYSSSFLVGEIQFGTAWEKRYAKSLNSMGKLINFAGGENFKGKDDKGKGGDAVSGPCCH